MDEPQPLPKLRMWMPVLIVTGVLVAAPVVYVLLWGAYVLLTGQGVESSPEASGTFPNPGPGE